MGHNLTTKQRIYLDDKAAAAKVTLTHYVNACNFRSSLNEVLSIGV
jgi:hypothetical protein